MNVFGLDIFCVFLRCRLLVVWMGKRLSRYIVIWIVQWFVRYVWILNGILLESGLGIMLFWVLLVWCVSHTKDWVYFSYLGSKKYSC